jgi:hypothetical protein
VNVVDPADAEEEAEVQLDADVPIRTSLVATIILWIVFAALYAYPLFEGISNLVALPPYYDSLGIGGAVPWWLLGVGIAAPVLLYLAALWVGRGRELFPRALLLAVGLAATNALALSVVQWAAALQPAVKS